MITSTLSLDCSGPEIRGSVAWFIPQRVEWTVTIRRSSGSSPLVFVHATVHGDRPDQPGVRARGAADFAEDSEWLRSPPEWLVRPTEWIDAVTKLSLDALNKEDTQG